MEPRKIGAYRDMLRDLVSFFRRVGAQADSEAGNLGDTDHFHEGRAAAYREVLNSMKNHAESFGVPLDDLGLDDFDPLRDPLTLPPGLDTEP